MSSRFSNFTRLLAVNLLILLAGILLIEYIYGNWRGTQGLLRTNVPRGVEIVWDISDLYPSTTGKAIYKRDHLGLRGPFKHISQVKLVTLGGSTTDQRLVSEGETWQDVLVQDFHKAGKDLQVINAGVDGQSALGHGRTARVWLRFIKDLHPRYTLAYVGINDMCFDPKMYEGYLENDRSLRSQIVRKSALYYLYRTLRGIVFSEGKPDYKVRPDESAGELTDKPKLQSYEMFNDELTAYERRLHRMIKRMREFSGEPILMTQMVNQSFNEKGDRVGAAYEYGCWGESVNEVDTVRILELLNERTLKVCKEEGLTCFDLAKELKFERGDFYDLEHNAPPGSAKIGHYLYQKMKDLNF